MGAYHALLIALKKTSQLHVRNIVFGPLNRMFQKAPSEVRDFMEDPQSQTLILVCINESRTSRRILDTVPSACVLHFKKFLTLAPHYDCTKIYTLTKVIDLAFIMKQVEAFTNSLKKVIVLHEKKQAIPELKSVSAKTVKESICYSDLSPFQQLIITERVSKTLYLYAEDVEMLFEQAQDSFIVDILYNDTLKLFANTVPLLPSYYVNRSLVTRNVVKINLTEQLHRNCFVVKNIDRSTLSQIFPKEPTVTSTEIFNTKSEIIIHCIVLESEHHVPYIIEKAGAKAVHFLEYKDGQLLWLKSTRNFKSIRGTISDNQVFYTDENLFMRILEADNPSPVCLSDTAGMGKTVLMSYFVTKLKESNRTVVFATFRDLIQKVRDCNKKITLLERIVLALGSICKAMPCVVNWLQNGKVKIQNLFLDGFDELKGNDIEFALECLWEIRKKFIGTRLWVSTRPHYLAQMEELLQVFGYHIQPFNVVDQTKFLVLYWSRGKNNSEKEKLTNYAKSCVSHIKTVANKEIDKFAGIPLQCLLIGCVYEDAAHKHCVEKQTGNPSFIVTSVAELYHELIRKKYEKYTITYRQSNASADSIDQIHMQYALKYMFPNLPTGISDQYLSNLSKTEVFDMGIMEPKTQDSMEPQFIHWTFAEYFVAKYLLRNIVAGDKSESFFCILLKILETVPVKIQNLPSKVSSSLKTYDLKYFIIGYFLDTGIKLSVHKRGLRYPTNRLEYVNENVINELAQSLSYRNFYHIYKLLIQPLFRKLRFPAAHIQKSLCDSFTG